MRFHSLSSIHNQKIVLIPVKLTLSMRLVAFSVCVFLNVMLFGMCSYMYLLWLQYWHKIWNRDKQPEEPSYEMSDFRRNEVIVEYYDDPVVPIVKSTPGNKKIPPGPPTPQTKNSKNAAIRLANSLKKRYSS